MGGGGSQRVDLQSDDEQFTVANHDIAVRQLHLAFAQRFHFPAFEYQARLKAFFKEVVVGRLFVVSNAGGGFGFLGHGVNLGL